MVAEYGGVPAAVYYHPLSEDTPVVISKDGIAIQGTSVPLRHLPLWTPSAEEAKPSPQYLLQT